MYLVSSVLSFFVVYAEPDVQPVAVFRSSRRSRTCLSVSRVTWTVAGGGCRRPAPNLLADGVVVGSLNSVSAVKMSSVTEDAG